MIEKNIKELIEELVKRSGSSASVIIENHFPDHRMVGGKYNSNNHTVTIYLEEIREQCQQVFLTDDFFLDYVAVVLAHELGHAEDSELEFLSNKLYKETNEIEKKKIALKIEENAWEFAEKLIPEMDQAFMKTIIYFALKSYREELQPVG
ncbi:MAG TPA: hypothetical protein VEY51_00025 [Chondromyces sp.]|nr:hypothetical protein [Chondromyces sp.]